MKAGIALTALVAVAATGCPRTPPPPADGALSSGAKAQPHLPVAVSIYDGGLQNGWQDYGWTNKQMTAGQPARVRFDDFGGWILFKGGLTGDFGGVTFRVKEPPAEGEFLEVHLLSTGGEPIAKVKVTADDRVDLGDGWTEIFVPMDQLDPKGVAFDRVVLQAFRQISAQPIEIDKVALTQSTPRPAPSTFDPSDLRAVTVKVDCRARATKVSPYIYGMADYPFDDADKAKAAWLLGATIRRWGGNSASTYNWELGAWNTGSDYFFENVQAPPWAQFLEENAAHGIPGAVTVPMMGWVSKDTTSSSFAVSVVGEQEKTDPWRKDAGDGKDPKGKAIPAPQPDRVYVPITPDYVHRWVQAIRAHDAQTGKRSVTMYILDNEPGLWNTTHRDVHPDPVSYDELVQRTIAFGTAIREADPDAVIAGPAEWGWTNYFYSSKDMASGGTSARPDRRAHGDVPIVAYYLKALADHEKQTGVRVLDVLDLHAYPQGDGIYGDNADPDTAARRIRSTRMLWDPTYVDESWIKDAVRLLPRMREWVDQDYPGRGLSIGEWNFGGQQHASGGLAVAEALGRFAQYGLTSAYYWTYPPADSPAMWAFHAYRNFDGKGGRFLDWYTPSTTSAEHDASAFVSRDETGKHLVAVALNFSPKDAVAATVDVTSCGTVSKVRSFTYEGGPSGFVASASTEPAPTQVLQAVPPYSIVVFDVTLDGAAPVAK